MSNQFRTGPVDLISELHLWASVVELAVKDYFIGTDELMWDAAYWIFDTTPDDQFNSFENLCYALDLDPEAVRDRLKNMNAAMYQRYATSLDYKRIRWPKRARQ